MIFMFIVLYNAAKLRNLREKLSQFCDTIESNLPIWPERIFGGNFTEMILLCLLCLFMLQSLKKSLARMLTYNLV